MGREDRSPAELGDRAVEALAVPPHAAAEALELQEGRVPLVHVPDRRLDAQRLEGARAADAEHELLGEAHLAPRRVENAGDRTVGRVVLRHVGVEQQQRHAPDEGDPDLEMELAAAVRDRDHHRPAGVSGRRTDRQAGEVVLGVDVLLAAVGVDVLVEVAVPVEEPDSDQRHAQVAGALQVIAGEDAEAAGIERQAGIEAVLHAEVGDRPVELRVALREPGLGATGHVGLEHPDDLLVEAAEVLVLEFRLPVVVIEVDQQLDGIAVERPGAAVHRGEELAGGRVPGPPEIAGEVVQALHLARQLDAGDVQAREIREVGRHGADSLFRSSATSLFGGTTRQAIYSSGGRAHSGSRSAKGMSPSTQAGSERVRGPRSISSRRREQC